MCIISNEYLFYIQTRQHNFKNEQDFTYSTHLLHISNDWILFTIQMLSNNWNTFEPNCSRTTEYVPDVDDDA